MTEQPFISINELAKRISVPAHTLRYWEREFGALIRPVTGAGGRRYYRPDTVAVIDQIRALLHESGYTIAGVKKLLRDGNFGNTFVSPSLRGSGAERAEGELNKNSPPKMEGTNPADPTPEIDRAIKLLQSALAALAE